MNFAGMVFELMLSGVWWTVALGLWVYVILGAPKPVGEWLTSLLSGDEKLGATFALVFFVVAYSLGQVGRRLARWLYRDYRKWITAVEVHNRYVLPDVPERLHSPRVPELEGALVSLTGLDWKGGLDWSLRQIPGSLGVHDRLGSNPVRRDVDAFLWWWLVSQRHLCAEQKKAADNIRYASDTLRDYVFASDRNDLRRDLMYHWQCMDAAQNAVLPALVSGVALVALAARWAAPAWMLPITAVLWAAICAVPQRVTKFVLAAALALCVLVSLVAVLCGGLDAVLIAGATVLVVWLLHRSFCEHARYLTDAIFRTFHIAWAQRQDDLESRRGAPPPGEGAGGTTTTADDNG